MAELALPLNDTDVRAFLNGVRNHPDTIEYKHRQAGLIAEMRSRGFRDPKDKVTHWSLLRHHWNHTFARRRRDLHSEIVAQLMGEAEKPGKGKPLAVILMGPPGSGKTTTAVPLIQERAGVKLLSINPDSITGLSHVAANINFLRLRPALPSCNLPPA